MTRKDEALATIAERLEAWRDTHRMLYLAARSGSPEEESQRNLYTNYDHLCAIARHAIAAS